METFGDRLEQLRGNLTQREFARQLGVPLTSYTNWTTGARAPSMDYIVMICTKLGVSADWLLGLKIAPAPEQAEAKLKAIKEALVKIVKEF